MNFKLGYFHLNIFMTLNQPALGLTLGFRRKTIPVVGCIECFGIWVFLVSFCFHFGIDYLTKK